MLNYIWLGLIVVGIFVGLGRDVAELSENKYKNGEPMTVHVDEWAVNSPNHYTASAYLTKSELADHYGADRAEGVGDTVRFPMDVVTSSIGPRGQLGRGSAIITVPDHAPKLWKEAAESNGDATKFNGRVQYSLAPGGASVVRFTADEVRFRIMSKILNDGIISITDVAVKIAIGLIGIMALWLGIMKIAEAAGLVASLAKLVKPIMVRIFPDVPADHPAMGAMVMNMTANFLGLSNAATPMGLKAMEELNKLNPVAGTATNAMCMFLTINTTALTLVPATVIAIRFTLGADDPASIIMPTFLATLISLILGVTFTKFIQRFFPIEPKETTVASNN